jgi:uncharacterized phage-like protein YoqJ
MKIVAVSGYKPFELGIFRMDHPGVHFIKKALEKQLRLLMENGLEWVLISGQLGVELWAAEVTYDLQEEFPAVKVAVITPFLEQEVNWNEENKEYYEMILAQADFVDSITKRKYESPMQFRMKNQFFVQKSDGLLLVYDEERPGSPKYIYEEAKKRAKKVPYEIILINFFDMQTIVEEEQLSQHHDW